MADNAEATDEITSQVSFQGKQHSLLLGATATVLDLQSALVVATGVIVEEQRIMVAGKYRETTPDALLVSLLGRSKNRTLKCKLMFSQAHYKDSEGLETVENIQKNVEVLLREATVQLGKSLPWALNAGGVSPAKLLDEEATRLCLELDGVSPIGEKARVLRKKLVAEMEHMTTRVAEANK